MISSLLINFLLFLALGYYLKRYHMVRTTISLLLKISLLVGGAWLTLTSVGYLLTPLIFDHAESNIATVASLYLKGGGIYTELNSPMRYSLLYGPWPYLVAAFFESFQGSVIAMAKLPGVLNLWLMVACTVLLSSRLSASRFQKILVICVVPLALLGYYNFSYWNRPDSYIMTYVFCALTAVLFAPRWSFLGSAAVLGLLAGLAANSKLHAFLYFVPIAVYFYESYRFPQLPLKIFVAALMFVFGLVAPFLFPNVGAENYILWLQMASKHGLELGIFLKNITFIASFLLLLFFSRFGEKYKFSFAALCIVSFFIAVIASKPGAGQHHFLPFVPLILWLTIEKYFSFDTETRNSFQIFAAAFLLTLTMNGVNRQKQIVKFLSQTAVREKELSDLLDISSAEPGKLELGIAGNKTYEATFYKAALVAQDKGLLLDGAALMDMQASGVDIPTSTLETLKSCEIKSFVFPKNEKPWSIFSFYGDKPLFSDEFISTFKSAYRLERETDFYAVYKCR